MWHCHTKSTVELTVQSRDMSSQQLNCRAVPCWQPSRTCFRCAIGKLPLVVPLSLRPSIFKDVPASLRGSFSGLYELSLSSSSVTLSLKLLMTEGWHWAPLQPPDAAAAAAAVGACMLSAASVLCAACICILGHTQEVTVNGIRRLPMTRCETWPICLEQHATLHGADTPQAVLADRYAACASHSRVHTCR